VIPRPVRSLLGAVAGVAGAVAFMAGMHALEAAIPPAPVYCPKPARSTTAVRTFEKATGYPTGRPGYVVDHKIPLCACGRDAPTNMAWQDTAAARRKDVFEKALCAELRKQTTPAAADTARTR
jgi:hypothetical protein